MEYFKALIVELRANPTATFCALMVAVIAYMGMFIVSQQRKMDDLQTAFRLELNASDRRCATAIDALTREYIAEMKDANKRQAEIEQQIRKIKQR